jgi:hypothetical protein
MDRGWCGIVAANIFISVLRNTLNYAIPDS